LVAIGLCPPLNRLVGRSMHGHLMTHSGAFWTKMLTVSVPRKGTI